ncbi:unnamed protein product [Amoebophrya sp. A25]|nr:unnamed protein product [Amoebophrya sp. A25]|eukprot:GSA25T00019361001.1
MVGNELPTDEEQIEENQGWIGGVSGSLSDSDEQAKFKVVNALRDGIRAEIDITDLAPEEDTRDSTSTSQEEQDKERLVGTIMGDREIDERVEEMQILPISDEFISAVVRYGSRQILMRKQQEHEEAKEVINIKGALVEALFAWLAEKRAQCQHLDAGGEYTRSDYFSSGRNNTTSLPVSPASSSARMSKSFMHKRSPIRATPRTVDLSPLLDKQLENPYVVQNFFEKVAHTVVALWVKNFERVRNMK